MGLVLDPKTGLTSPQFHIQVDDNFDTVNKTDKSICSTWLMKTGLKWVPCTKKTTIDTLQQKSTASPLTNNINNVDMKENTVQEPDKTVEGNPIPEVRRSTRTKTQPVRLTYTQQSLLMEEEPLEDLYCQAASADPDTMYLHEARRDKKLTY